MAHCGIMVGIKWLNRHVKMYNHLDMGWAGRCDNIFITNISSRFHVVARIMYVAYVVAPLADLSPRAHGGHGLSVAEFIAAER